jgi:hypothetical protein
MPINRRTSPLADRTGWRLAAAVMLAGATASLGAVPLAAQQAGDDAESVEAEIAAMAATSHAAADELAVSAGLRLREGTQLSDALGYFRQNGESLTFVDKEGRQLGGLPNLGLERVGRMLKSVEEPESITWSVSGMVTEFGGRNYLLVSRAVYKAAAPPPAPDSL